MGSITKLIARNIIFPIFYYSKIPHVFSNLSSKKRMILYYHGVSNSPVQRYSGKPFSSDNFEMHLQYLLKNFDILSLKDIFKMYRENINPKKTTVAITFDDGYENNYSVVYPLLKKYGIPATFFVSACSIINPDDILWHDLIHFVNHVGRNDIVVDKYKFKKDYKHEFYDFDNNLSIQLFIKQLKYKQRNEFLERLKQDCNITEVLKNIDPSQWKLMNKEQIFEISQSDLVEIGSHGYSHVNLANIEEDFAISEIVESKKIIEEAIGNQIISFSFPDGSYNEKIKKICIEAGYMNLVAVTYQNSEDINDKSILLRHGPSSTTNYYSNIFFIHNSFNLSGF